MELDCRCNTSSCHLPLQKNNPVFFVARIIRPKGLKRPPPPTTTTTFAPSGCRLSSGTNFLNATVNEYEKTPANPNQTEPKSRYTAQLRESFCSFQRNILLSALNERGFWQTCVQEYEALFRSTFPLFGHGDTATDWYAAFEVK